MLAVRPPLRCVFWTAYTIARPLGASFADWLAVPAPYGDGLQLGTDVMSLTLGVVLLALIVVIDVRHRRGGVHRSVVSGDVHPPVSIVEN